jgi:hypothetical protein
VSPADATVLLKLLPPPLTVMAIVLAARFQTIVAV